MRTALCIVGWVAAGLALLAWSHWRALRWHTRADGMRRRVAAFALLLGVVGLWCLAVAVLGGD